MLRIQIVYLRLKKILKEYIDYNNSENKIANQWVLYDVGVIIIY